MIADTVRFLKEHGREVIYDAEHFFDGYKDNPEYAWKTLQAAREAGADVLVLCDTNGGTLPHEVRAITREVIKRVRAPIGIHTHNDAGWRGQLAGGRPRRRRAGAGHDQRLRRALRQRQPVLHHPEPALKMGYATVLRRAPAQLRDVSLFVDELANVRPTARRPFVGDSAFAHKAGMHVDAVRKNPRSFEHIDPERSATSAAS
jgi:2-isopropylmalate synthase